MEKLEILTERNVIVEVLEKYRKLAYLWNPTHKLYTNKNARRQGLEILLKSWRKLEPNASIECMRKKLNNWRAAYRRERNKVAESLLSSPEPDEVHKPNLWYYDYLTFIHDDCPVLSKDEDDPIPIDTLDGRDDDTSARNAAVDNTDSDDGDSDEKVIIEVPEKKPRMSVKSKSNDISDKPEQLLDPVLINSNEENSADLFGRAIGSQLKELPKFQRCLAEKLISEIMFYAKIEQLTISTSVNLEPSSS